MNRRHFLKTLPAASLLASCTIPTPGGGGGGGGFALGIDVLKNQGFAPLRGKRVGLILNQTSVDGRGTPTRVVLQRALGSAFTTLYTPEHGLDGKEKAGLHVTSRMDPVTGLIAHSLYGSTRKPTAR